MDSDIFLSSYYFSYNKTPEEEKWNDLLKPLQNEYINCYKNGSPKCSEITDSGIAAARFCNCSDKEVSTRAITCFFYTGIKKVNFTFCKCEENSITLLRHNLIASSPFLPRMAFHISHLEWYSLLRAEGHLSCQAFANAFAMMHNLQINDTLRKSLANAFFMYQQVKNGVDQQLIQAELQEIPEEETAACPACPTKGEEAHMTVAIDGNHQLRRLKRNDQDIKKATCNIFFEADNYQELFGDEVERNIPNSSDGCKYLKKHRVHEPGILRCVCKHNIPLEFTNMYESGERYKYPLSLIKVLVQKYGPRINCLYDIGCRFSAAVDKYYPQLKDHGSKVAIGVFHAYCHSMECQIYNNPRYIDNFGLVDGEGMERLWSTIGNLPFTCVRRRRNKAMKVLENASKFIHTYNPSLTDDELQEKWDMFVQESIFEPSSNATVTRESLKQKYARELHELYEHSLNNRRYEDSVQRLESVLVSRNIITVRWGKDSIEYQEAFTQAQDQDLAKTMAQLKSVIVGRTVLQDQLYHTTKLGHKTSKRLKVAIQNVKKTATPVLNRYNTICSNLGKPENHRKYEEICNLNNDFWNFTSNLISFRVLREFMNKRRAIEGFDIIRTEEIRVKSYAERCCKALEKVVKKEGPWSVGWKMLVYQRFVQAEKFYYNVYGTTWERNISIPRNILVGEAVDIYDVTVEEEVEEEDVNEEDVQHNDISQSNYLYDKIEDGIMSDDEDEDDVYEDEENVVVDN
ncbi:hypothetical protein INT45_005217 [Circinella minor]|uniref:CxC1-like cysteine cluster associated with KDZ transposases domain-containing protein n=1 Tax=Circinella minor TaxID=1195481 RepID=A0A8H7RRL1_9FUNG|nr:hypothetical protein INT45_005217 [Circinella minor]